jgi:hypothetical protein
MQSRALFYKKKARWYRQRSFFTARVYVASTEMSYHRAQQLEIGNSTKPDEA